MLGTFGMSGILAFFIGHILPNLAWSGFASYGIQFGGSYVSLGVIKNVLLVCSIFLIIFKILFIIKGYNFIRLIN